jgi:hypothetical protein
MAPITFSYDRYGEAQSDLAAQIKTIAWELEMLTRLLQPAKSFLPNEDLSVNEFVASVKNQIESLGTRIKGAELGIDEEEVSQRYALFNLQANALFKRLDAMDSLPGLGQEETHLKLLEKRYASFEEDLPNRPNPGETEAALLQTTALLKSVNAAVESARENPLVQLAECWFNGAKVAEHCYPEPKGPSPSAARPR